MSSGKRVVVCGGAVGTIDVSAEVVFVRFSDESPESSIGSSPSSSGAFRFESGRPIDCVDGDLGVGFEVRGIGGTGSSAGSLSVLRRFEKASSHSADMILVFDSHSKSFDQSDAPASSCFLSYSNNDPSLSSRSP